MISKNILEETLILKPLKVRAITVINKTEHDLQVFAIYNGSSVDIEIIENAKTGRK